MLLWLSQSGASFWFAFHACLIDLSVLCLVFDNFSVMLRLAWWPAIWDKCMSYNFPHVLTYIKCNYASIVFPSIIFPFGVVGGMRNLLSAWAVGSAWATLSARELDLYALLTWCPRQFYRMERNAICLTRPAQYSFVSNFFGLWIVKKLNTELSSCRIFILYQLWVCLNLLWHWRSFSSSDCVKIENWIPGCSSA